MKVHVFDTRVTTQAGAYIHFDVLVDDANVSNVKQFAERYLTSIKVSAADIKLGQCNFCHTELANPEVQSLIEKQGYTIIPL